MNKIMLALCLLGLGVACKSTGADVNASAAEPCGADCQMDCCKGEEGACSEAMKAECKEGEVCPVTGKSMN